MLVTLRLFICLETTHKLPEEFRRNSLGHKYTTFWFWFILLTDVYGLLHTPLELAVTFRWIKATSSNSLIELLCFISSDISMNLDIWHVIWVVQTKCLVDLMHFKDHFTENSKWSFMFTRWVLRQIMKNLMYCACVILVFCSLWFILRVTLLKCVFLNLFLVFRFRISAGLSALLNVSGLGLLDCDAVYCCGRIPTFRGTLLPPSAGWIWWSCGKMSSFRRTFVT
jgi:hypothetical protein